MSFGRPPTFNDFKVSPPQRGSFPLDHDGECTAFMATYLQCLKSYGQQSVNCRPLSKEYLECRMSKGLMERTEWKKLGYQPSGGGNVDLNNSKQDVVRTSSSSET